MAVVSIIPKCAIEDESITTLRDMGIKVEEGYCNICKVKVNCIKVYNLTETQVFDKLDSRTLLESTDDVLKTSFASRAISIVFMQIRKVQAIKDKDLKAVGAASLLAAISSLATLDIKVANKFLSLVRSLSA